MIGFWLIGIGTLTVGSVVEYWRSSSVVQDRALDQLKSVRILKLSKLQAYYADQFEEIERLAALPANTPPDTALWRRKGWLAVLTAPPHSLPRLGPGTPPRADSLLRQACAQAQPGQPCLTDLCLLPGPAATAPPLGVQFLAARGPQGLTVAVLLDTALNRILAQRTGLGESGETYLVGPDSLMRTDSRFFAEKTLLRRRAATPATTAALSGQQGEALTVDYRGIEVLSSYMPFRFGGFRGALLSEIDAAEVVEPMRAQRNFTLLLGLVIGLPVALLGYWVAIRISRPVLRLRNQIKQLSAGNLTPADATLVAMPDEVGQMARAVDQLTHSLQRAVAFAVETGNNQFDAPFQPASPADRLGFALLEMRNKLRAYTEDLSQKNEELRSLTEQRVNEEIQRNKIRTAAILEGQEAERARVARDLHDGVGQLLTALRFQIASLDLPQADADDLRDVFDELVAEVRRISNNLSPAVLTDFGLTAALRQLAAGISRMGRIQVQFACNLQAESAQRLPQPVEIALYRMAQELLHNAQKYSGAPQADVRLDRYDNRVCLTVHDNGRGFDPDLLQRPPAGPDRHHGLRHLQERVRLLGGTVAIHTAPGQGVRVEIEIPVVSDAETQSEFSRTTRTT